MKTISRSLKTMSLTQKIQNFSIGPNSNIKRKRDLLLNKPLYEKKDSYNNGDEERQKYFKNDTQNNIRILFHCKKQR